MVMPEVVGVRHGPSVRTRALARGLAYQQGLGETETVSEGLGKAGSGEVEPSPKRSGEAGLAPKGSGEAEPVLGG
jgi:hypothetical protein